MDNTYIFLVITDYYLDRFRNTYNNYFIDNLFILKKLRLFNSIIYTHVTGSVNGNYLDEHMTNLTNFISKKKIYIDKLLPNTHYCPYECIGNWRHFVIEYINGRRGSLRICTECGSRITPRNYLRSF